MRNMKSFTGRLLSGAAIACSSLLALTAQAAAPGITTTTGTRATFTLNAAAAYISQPDGESVYSWGYGCTTGSALSFSPTGMAGAACSTMQIPGPTLIVNQGATITVTLTNNLPPAAGNTSILFPGFSVTATGGAPGVLTQEATHGGTVTYSFVASTPGTHSYYSGTRGNLQVEMGLYGAIIVLPTLTSGLPTGYTTPPTGNPATCHVLGSRSTAGGTEADYRLAAAAFDNPAACYDREYLFQFSEMDPAIHRQAEEQSVSPAGVELTCVPPTGCMNVVTEPYKAAYFLINGRSMPDDMDPNYATQYPHQPYNGNPHMHPGELTLVRIVGQGRMQHPFHEHANHLRLLARDGNLILSQSTGSTNLAGPLLFTTTTTPGQTMDGIFQWTGKGLNWDVYGHGPANSTTTADAITATACHPDANGYFTSGSTPAAPSTANNYYEWCGDHGRPLEDKPFGSVGSGGPVTLPDANIVANGAWYSGSPYLGPDANLRSVGTTPIPPFGTVANSPSGEAGFAYMWHSHNEREITTNNIFPGGMMMMMLVDPWVYNIDEAK
jgi:FtsP/CotA-like multicopper oxidase with cupredoxin domain